MFFKQKVNLKHNIHFFFTEFITYYTGLYIVELNPMTEKLNILFNI